MAATKGPKKLNGWALDAPDGDGAEPEVTLRQKLGDNNKLWLMSLVAVVLITGILLFSARQEGNRKLEGAEPPPPAPERFDDRGAYTDFATRFANNDSHSGSLISAYFLSPGKFRIVVPGNVSADDIEYLAKRAAESIYHDFQHRVVVQVYMKSAVDGREYLAATSRWESEKFGFAVSLKDLSSRGQ